MIADLCGSVVVVFRTLASHHTEYSPFDVGDGILAGQQGGLEKSFQASLPVLIPQPRGSNIGIVLIGGAAWCPEFRRLSSRCRYSVGKAGCIIAAV